MWRFLPLAVLLAPSSLRAAPGRPVRAGRLPAPGRGRCCCRRAGYLLTVYWAIELGVSTGTTALVDGTQPLVVAALAGPLLGAVVAGRQWLGPRARLVGVAVVTMADAFAPGSGAARLGVPAALRRHALPGRGHVPRAAVPGPLAPLRVLTIHCLTSGVDLHRAGRRRRTAAPPAEPAFWVAHRLAGRAADLRRVRPVLAAAAALGVTAVNTLMFLVPPVTALWGAALFGEPLTPLTISGFAVALAATALVTVRSSERPSSPTCSTPSGGQVTCSTVT